MGKYLLKRLGQSIIAILGITVVVFFILHLTGNPVELMVSPTTSKEEMEILSEEMGFNDPLPVQYVRFLKGALVGDFGTSYYYNEPAMSVVLERAPATLTLACAALLISVVLGIPAGIVAAVKRNSGCWPCWANACPPSGWASCSSCSLLSSWAGCPLAAQRMACVP